MLLLLIYFVLRLSKYAMTFQFQPTLSLLHQVTFLAFSLYLPTLDREVEGEFIDLPEPITIPGCSPVRPGDLVDQVRNRKIDEYKWCLFHLSRLPLAAGIFLNSWEDLEPVSLKTIREHPFYLQIPTPPVYPIGPLIKQDEQLTISDKEYLAWLDKQPPDSVLFVAHGSGGTLSSEQITEMAWGLELSKQRFLWVVRTPSDASAATFFNVGSDVNDPKAYMPEGFLEKTQGVGMVGTVVGSAGDSATTSINRWVFISLWVELFVGQRIQWRANDRMATLCRTKNECFVAYGGDWGGRKASKRTWKEGDRTGRNKQGSEVGNGE
ncbi:hypothetical protein Patl1_09104 [Pistacia atlantica]|uniref:Uncharacterized protein n=1 Tax=Pistacia atlantica TaxID=434234 RepID=A0ACC1AL13_9ROSI|nr:hypothetical protein Patl1_09104 [Pistacia atlantica]